jgi:pimeloyl-ACP methyl ester carboxylesterase
MWLLALLMLADSSRPFPLVLPRAESLQVTIAGAEADAPVVLIPGLFGSAFAYRKVIPRLTAAGYRAIVIEPLGVGSSGRPERADYSLTAQADRIAAALDQLGVTGAVIVAHATSASIAYRLAYRRPGLVRAVVSLEGGPVEAAATPGMRRALRFAPWVKLFGGVRLIRRKIRENLIAASGDASWVSDTVVDGYTVGAARDLDGTLRAYRRMAEARERERLEPHLSAIVCPVLLLLGGAPHGGGPRPAELVELGDSLRSFAVDTVAGAGHFVHEERPDAVAAAVARFGPGTALSAAAPVGTAKP